MAVTDKPYQTFLLTARSLPREYYQVEDILAKSENRRPMRPKASRKKRGKAR